ncbi:hypothetical protein BDR04DRAFT_1045758 [Suillus decipiens]|nr:hypothetical protein BDR04DRAFT_1045758 [Suillus decipiens]
MRRKNILCKTSNKTTWKKIFANQSRFCFSNEHKAFSIWMPLFSLFLSVPNLVFARLGSVYSGIFITNSKTQMRLFTSSRPLIPKPIYLRTFSRSTYFNMDFSKSGSTTDDLNIADLLGDGVSGHATQATATMEERPGLLKHSPFPLECTGQQCEVSVFPGSPRSSDVSAMPSNLSAVAVANDTSAVSRYTPSEFERKSYYNGITADGKHPQLVYRSDCLTTPFLKPSGRDAHLSVKSIRGVSKTSLSGIWNTVGSKICELLGVLEIEWSSIDPVRFFTHESPEEEEMGSLGPVVIWVGVVPNSTSSDTAHNASQEILKLLQDHGVEDVVVEWRESVVQRLAGV